MIDVIEYLSSIDIHLSIVTTIPEFKFIKAIEPISEYFDVIVKGANAKCAKGNPKMYQYDLNEKSVDLQNNLFVGDDLYYDIEIPKTLNQITRYINRQSAIISPDDKQFIDFIITSLTEVRNIV